MATATGGALGAPKAPASASAPTTPTAAKPAADSPLSFAAQRTAQLQTSLSAGAPNTASTARASAAASSVKDGNAASLAAMFAKADERSVTPTNTTAAAAAAAAGKSSGVKIGVMVRPDAPYTHGKFVGMGPVSTQSTAHQPTVTLSSGGSKPTARPTPASQFGGNGSTTPRLSINGRPSPTPPAVVVVPSPRAPASGSAAAAAVRSPAASTPATPGYLTPPNRSVSAPPVAATFAAVPSAPNAMPPASASKPAAASTASTAAAAQDSGSGVDRPLLPLTAPSGAPSAPAPALPYRITPPAQTNYRLAVMVALLAVGTALAWSRGYLCSLGGRCVQM